MNYAIIYSSRTGNTKLLAETIRETLPQEDCIYFGAPDAAALNAERIYVGFWTDKGSCDAQTAAFLKDVKEQELYLFGTAGFGGSQEYFDKVLERTQANIDKSVPLIGSFMCQGKMPMSVRQRYEQMQNSPAKIPNIEDLIENFDKALDHPNQNDLDALKTKLQQTI